ncbi:MAG: DUF4184 family protein, partial [Candidatus Hodarchaeales archaeon]|jgi:membrane-bound metal-dependent hydrolase YbcI (DUF457 family)
MPFTPFHWGVSLFIQACFLFLDPFALFIGSIIPDMEGITSLFLFPELDLPLHGPLHSLLGASILGSIVGLCSWFCFKYLFPKIIEICGIEISFSLPIYSLKISLLSSFIGTFSHVLLDAPLYYDMNPWYPITTLENPLLYTIEGGIIYLFCTICFVIGVVVLSIRVFQFYNKKT